MNDSDLACPFCAWDGGDARALRDHVLAQHPRVFPTSWETPPFDLCPAGEGRAVWCWCGRRFSIGFWPTHLRAAGGAQAHVAALILGDLSHVRDIFLPPV